MISIIVPVFNKERYIERCIRSIQCQTFVEFECILVDDGSKDNSKDLINKVIEGDNRFQYVYQENSGVSSARNKGFSLSKYPYICFIDADDYVNIDYLEMLYAMIQSNSCSLVISNYENKTEIIPINQLLLKFNNYYNYNIFNPPWGKLFKRELVSNLFDMHYSIGEDLLFNIQYLINNKDTNICLFNYFGYNYEEGINESLSNNVSIKSILELKNLILHLITLNGICLDKVVNIQSNSIFNKLLEYYAQFGIGDFTKIFNSKIENKILIESSSFRLKVIVLLLQFKLRFILKIYLSVMCILKGIKL